MASWHISRFEARPASAVVLRYGAAVSLVATALGTALILRSESLPHPFTSFSFAAIAITFWYGGTGPGLLALLLLFGDDRFLHSCQAHTVVHVGEEVQSEKVDLVNCDSVSHDLFGDGTRSTTTDSPAQ